MCEKPSERGGRVNVWVVEEKDGRGTSEECVYVYVCVCVCVRVCVCVWGGGGRGGCPTFRAQPGAHQALDGSGVVGKQHSQAAVARAVWVRRCG